MKNHITKYNVFHWALSGGVGTLITGIIVYFFINYKISLLNYTIFLSILIIIATIGLGFRAWYFNQEFYDKEKEVSFNNLRDSIKLSNKSDNNEPKQ